MKKKTNKDGFIVTNAPMTDKQKAVARIAMMRVARLHKRGTSGRRFIVEHIAQMY